jgi:hypothetical protein
MLWNFTVCLYGSQAAQYFQYDPVDISEYLKHILETSGAPQETYSKTKIPFRSEVIMIDEVIKVPSPLA